MMLSLCSNFAFSMKLWRVVRPSNSLWASFMRKKYAYKQLVTDCSNKVWVSSVWLRLFKAKEATEKYMKWIISNVEINFWKEKCWQGDRLDDLIEVPCQLKDLTVQEALSYDFSREDVCLLSFYSK